MKTLVIIPAFQEEKNIFLIVSECIKSNLDVLVIDDGSSDNTSEQAKAAGAQIIKHLVNQGKGAALKSGISFAKSGEYNYVVFMDGDGQHLPREIPYLLEKLIASKADLVIGNRMFDVETMPFLRLVTNRLMSYIISRITGQDIPDTQCGFRVFKKTVFDKIDLVSDKYEIDSEILIKASFANMRIDTEKITTIYNREPSRINPFIDTLRFFKFIILAILKKVKGALWRLQ